MFAKDSELSAQLTKTLKELEFCEKRWRNVLANSPHGILIVAAGGTIRFANPAASAIFGCHADELLGERFEIPAISDTPAELNVKARDGRTVVVEVWRIETELGGKPAWFVALNNVTERKKMEEELRESEERFRATFNQAGVGITHIDLEGHWLRINRRFCEIVGYTEAELQALTITDITHPDDVEISMRHLHLLLEGKEESYSLEKRYIRKDGSIVWINLNVSMVSYPDGIPRYHVGVVEDITARKLAEEELRRSEERYRRLYNDTPVMLHSIDHDGRLVSVSNYWLETLGYERREVIGRKTTEFLTPASRRYATEVVLPEFFRTGTCKEVPYQIVTKTGEILDVLLSAIAERNDDGMIVRSLAVLIDVTGPKRAQEEVEKLNTDLAARAMELENANQELEAFSYSVSHDLRKPLTAINGYCQIIREMCSAHLDTQCRGYLQEIHDGTLRMNGLIDALLNFSRMSHSELHRETVDLSGMAEEVAAALRLNEPERQATFRLAAGITVNGDAGLLRVVLENLLGNAWKYTGKREEAVIEFGVTEFAGMPACFVQDNGTGFAMADAEKLFIPFKRLPGADTFRGHGIGLATVERIVRRHGGKVWAQGEPDRGATFYFTLPE